MTTTVEIVRSNDFNRHFDKLSRKYKHLEADLHLFLTVLAKTIPSTVSGTVQIPRLGPRLPCPVYKVKHFRSKDFMGHGSRSGFRIIYSYMNNPHKIILIDIYHKNKQPNHDDELIKRVMAEFLKEQE